MEGEFWLGNENIHAITTQAKYELRVDLDDGNETRFAAYDGFSVKGSQNKYRLDLGDYKALSNAGT